ELKDEYLIPFNHHLKDFINTHPNDDIRTVTSALTSSYGTIFSRHDCIDADKLIYNQKAAPKEIFLNIQGSIDGMRHEIAAETLLDAAGYSYDYNVSAKEDSMGNDLYVYLESGWEPIDVKASVNAVQKSRLHNRRSKAVWTGLDWGDFTGSKGTRHGCLSIPYPSTDAQLTKADTFVHEIRTMVATNRQQANRVGAASLRERSDDEWWYCDVPCREACFPLGASLPPAPRSRRGRHGGIRRRMDRQPQWRQACPQVRGSYHGRPIRRTPWVRPDRRRDQASHSDRSAGECRYARRSDLCGLLVSPSGSHASLAHPGDGLTAESPRAILILSLN
ncbi:hypothetical protein B7Z17_05315, partial [Candidatus Saccharibacteria bacterium 32-49-10]